MCNDCVWWCLGEIGSDTSIFIVTEMGWLLHEGLWVKRMDGFIGDFFSRSYMKHISVDNLEEKNLGKTILEKCDLFEQM